MFMGDFVAKELLQQTIVLATFFHIILLHAAV